MTDQSTRPPSLVDREALPKPETMLAYASFLEKPQYNIKNGVRYKIPTGEVIEGACAALRFCAALSVSATAGREETPAARWRTEGKPDPHGNSYDCERAKLAHGSMTDDDLANAVFLNNNDIGILTAAKERIRWLSRALSGSHP